MTRSKLEKLICSNDCVVYDIGRFDLKLIIEKGFSRMITVYVIDRDTNEECEVDQISINADSDEEFCYLASKEIIKNERKYIDLGNDYFIQ